MDNRINLQDLAQGLASRKGISKKDAEAFVRNVFDIIQENIVADEQVKIKGLGTFKLVMVESRESVNVNTGERFVIESHPKITFTPDAVLRDQVNKPFADFQTVILNEGTSTEEMEYIASVVETEPQLVDMTEEVEEPVEETTDTRLEDEVSAPLLAMPEVPSSNEEKPNEETVTQAEEDVDVDILDKQESVPAEKAVVSESMSSHVVHQTVEEMTVHAQHVDHQTIEQVVSSALDKELSKRRGVLLSWGGVAAFFLLALMLMFGMFYLGYRMGDNIVEKPQPSITEDRTTNTVSPQGTKPVTVEPTPAELARKYPQVDGGEYWIVGTKEEHIMVAGDNLYKLARKAYGDKDLANYIIVYNQLSKPNNVLLGAKIKIPELVKKD